MKPELNREILFKKKKKLRQHAYLPGLRGGLGLKIAQKELGLDVALVSVSLSGWDASSLSCIMTSLCLFYMVSACSLPNRPVPPSSLVI